MLFRTRQQPSNQLQGEEGPPDFPMDELHESQVAVRAISCKGVCGSPCVWGPLQLITGLYPEAAVPMTPEVMMPWDGPLLPLSLAYSGRR